MRTNLLLGLAFGLLVSPDPPNADAIKREMEKLKGTWVWSSVTVKGKPFHDDEIKKGDVSYVIEGNSLKVEHKGVTTQEATLVLDPTTTPKSIDLTVKVSPNQMVELKGIYSLEGDTLKLCYGEAEDERPTSFEAKADSKLGLFVCKRKKP